MSEKLQPGTYLTLGFAVCTMMLVTGCMIAYTGVTMLHRHFDLFDEQTEAAVYVATAAWSFDAMQLAAAHHRETGDAKFLEQIEKRSTEAMECLDEAAMLSRTVRNKELTHKLVEEIRQCLELHREERKSDDERLRAESHARAQQVSDLFLELLERQEEIRRELAAETDAIAARLVTMIVVNGVIGVILCIFTGFFVARKLQPKPTEFDPYSPTGENPNRDLSLVADKLQEIVNLLRK